MNPTTDIDNKKMFSELIKKQMLVLGPDITLAKVRNVPGLTVDQNGEVEKIEGDPQVLLQALINQFVELSGMIVKKTMESILTSYPSMAGLAVGGIGMAPPQQPAPAVSKPQPASPSEHADVPASPPTVETSKPVEPPPMAAMSLESLNSTQPHEEEKKTSEPESFSSKEMADLNKALEELSKAPLSTENGTSAQPSVVTAAG